MSYVDSGSFTITIERPLNSIVLSSNSMELNKDASKNLSVSFDPSNTTDPRQVTWSSSNEGVAKVSSNGEVSGVSEGSATITARCGEKTASCTEMEIATNVFMSAISPKKDLSKNELTCAIGKFMVFTEIKGDYQETIKWLDMILDLAAIDDDLRSFTKHHKKELEKKCN